MKIVALEKDNPSIAQSNDVIDVQETSREHQEALLLCEQIISSKWRPPLRVTNYHRANEPTL